MSDVILSVVVDGINGVPVEKVHQPVSAVLDGNKSPPTNESVIEVICFKSNRLQSDNIKEKNFLFFIFIRNPQQSRKTSFLMRRKAKRAPFPHWSVISTKKERKKDEKLRDRPKNYKGVHKSDKAFTKSTFFGKN